MEQILDDLPQNESSKLEDWSAFVQPPHNEYYVEKWLLLEETGKDSFNVGAFFFGAFWMIYRKMYKEAIVTLVFIFLEACIEKYIISILELWEYEVVIGLLSSVSITTIIGFLGNRIYLNSANQKINKIRIINPDLPAYKFALAKVGGTSWVSVLVGLVLYFLFFAILSSVSDLFSVF